MAIVAALGLAGIVATGKTVHAETLTIAAAHSLKPAFQEILPMFEKEYGATVDVTYGPSRQFRRQIEQGAPIDVFLPEADVELEKLRKKGLTLNGGPRMYAQTSLVLVMSTASHAIAISFRDVASETRIALVDPKTSVLGEITAKALGKLYPAYQHRSQLLLAPHSDEVVNLIHADAADVGIVYRADAINNGRMRIIDETPAGREVPVVLGGAVVSSCRKALLPVAEAFLDFMTSPRIQKLLLKYGFDSVPSKGVTG